MTINTLTPAEPCETLTAVVGKRLHLRIVEEKVPSGDALREQDVLVWRAVNVVIQRGLTKEGEEARREQLTSIA